MPRYRTFIFVISLLLTVAALHSAVADVEPTCLGRPATIVGVPGTGDIIGTDGPDVIVGTSGNDIIRGLGGDDIICGGPGDDIIHGGPGNDIIHGGGGNDTIYGEAGNDRLLGGTGDDILRGGSGNDALIGGPGNDRLIGGPGNDTADFSGAPRGVAADLAAGTSTGDGADILVGIENLIGSRFDDVLSGDSGPNILRGGAGNDVLRGRAGDDVLHGEGGNDTLIGGSGDDELWGGPGDDGLHGGPGADLLMGGAGSDQLTGGSGADRLDGGTGNDVLWEFLRVDTHLAEGRPRAAGDVFAYSQVNLVPRTGWVLWQPEPTDTVVQGHEGTLTITNRPDGLLMIERIDPERYLLGIAEMPYSWPAAALQSQAIAARSYLASVLESPWGPMLTHGFDICDWSLCQVYLGTKYGWLEPWEEAVEATAGRILMHDGSPAATFYHSTSGATTRSIEDVWTNSSPVQYLKGVPVPPQGSPYEKWSYELPLDAFMDILARDGITIDGPVESVRTIVTDHGDGPYRVRIRSLEETREFPIGTILGALNRHALAHYGEHLPHIHHVLRQAALSPTFTARLRPDGNVLIRGQGWGHQIGMSQYGARALALEGKNARQILRHFYTGLVPQDDPGFIPDLIDVGLYYANGDRTIVLSPEGRHVLRAATGVIRVGDGGSIILRRHGADAVAVSSGH